MHKTWNSWIPRWIPRWSLKISEFVENRNSSIGKFSTKNLVASSLIEARINYNSAQIWKFGLQICNLICYGTGSQSRQAGFDSRPGCIIPQTLKDGAPAPRCQHPTYSTVKSKDQLLPNKLVLDVTFGATFYSSLYVIRQLFCLLRETRVALETFYCRRIRRSVCMLEMSRITIFRRIN